MRQSNVKVVRIEEPKEEIIKIEEKIPEIEPEEDNNVINKTISGGRFSFGIKIKKSYGK
jgi:hypothetical protein